MKTTFKDLINGEKPVLIDFYADWCGPCRMMPPILDKVKEQYGDGVRIVKIDVDQNQALSQELQVSSIPTLMIFQKGELKWREAGVPSAGALKSAVGEFISS